MAYNVQQIDEFLSKSCYDIWFDKSQQYVSEEAVIFPTYEERQISFMESISRDDILTQEDEPSLETLPTDKIKEKKKPKKNQIKNFRAKLIDKRMKLK